MRPMTRLPDLGPRGEGWVVLQGLLLLLLTGASWLDAGAWAGGLRSTTTLVALLLAVAGALLAGRGLRDLRSSLTALPRPKDDAELVEHGVYRLVRHPIYGGLVLLAFGWALFAASPSGIALAVALLAFFLLKAAREERWLAERYPGYGAYRARTRRLIPWLL